MKLNWGSGIAIFYTVFVIILVTIVVRALNMGVDLVEEEYYQTDINYEKLRQKKQDYSNLDSEISYQYLKEKNQIKLQFPMSQKDALGHLIFYRPSNSNLDTEFKILLNDESNFLINTEELVGGKWVIIAEYSSNNIQYYYETEVVL